MSNGDTPDLPPRDPAATAESADALPPDEAQATSAENPPAPAHPDQRRGQFGERLLRFLLVLFIAIVAAAVVIEMQTSWLQSWLFSDFAKRLTWQLKAQQSEKIVYPQTGPADQRQGYALLSRLVPRLQERGFTITRQVEFSPSLFDYAQMGFNVPYREKTQSGITLLDCSGTPFYQNQYPGFQYPSFATIPPLILNALLFIEDRHLLDDTYPLNNPAVDWPRFVNAAISQLGKGIGIQEHGSGGSTLATQVEKYRHSPDGRTSSATNKIQQMLSASVRAYLWGPLTLAARQQIALTYFNSVPLAAAPGYGEVHGLGDGLRVWFAADPVEVSRLLTRTDELYTDLPAQALALRQVVALLIAHRRPSYYLRQGREALESMTDSHLRLLAQERIIPERLKEAALAQHLTFRNFAEHSAVTRVDGNKARYVARGRLGQLLNVSLYDLDRLDLTARSALDYPLQQQVTGYLKQLADPQFAGEVGLFGERLLSAEKTADVRYSFTLFEKTDEGFKVRVQTDNTDQPFDINESSKLELGSTAKLRVLTTYLQIVSELYQHYAPMTPEQLRQEKYEPMDLIRRWAIGYLLQNKEASLPAMLQAALERKYSASPYETFFTGGGIHTFNNFRKEDNGRNPTLYEALQESINLPFVRLLRDIVRYSLYLNPDRSTLLSDDKDPRRQEYLKRFADREGKTYLQKFWRKYRGKQEKEQLQTLIDGMRPGKSKLAAVFRYLYPQASQKALGAFIQTNLPNESLTAKELSNLYQLYGPGKFSLPDQGYVARVHPLDLWLLGFLIDHPQATFQEAVKASENQRLEVYGWLFNSRHRSARDSRIRTMLEIEAFTDIHQRWQKVGYPFDHLVPSLATAIGSSGDRPAALAELIGIIQNDGIRLPVERIDYLHFAKNTPFETTFATVPTQGERVLPSEVATALRGALSRVVDAGTARRISGSFLLNDGTVLQMGGKTGTGDNRLEKVGRYGQVISSQALNRTATFVFYIGDKHFGTLTAFVEGSSADSFRFTSALPVQVLKGMVPLLLPVLDPHEQGECLPSATDPEILLQQQ